jgi:hypothetical protein
MTATKFKLTGQEHGNFMCCKLVMSRYRRNFNWIYKDYINIYYFNQFPSFQKLKKKKTFLLFFEDHVVATRCLSFRLYG